jgi:hypothetical protein
VGVNRTGSRPLSHSAASFVFAYDPHGLRAGSATKIAGAADRTIKSADVADLARYGLALKGEGELNPDRYDDED